MGCNLFKVKYRTIFFDYKKIDQQPSRYLKLILIQILLIYSLEQNHYIYSLTFPIFLFPFFLLFPNSFFFLSFCSFPLFFFNFFPQNFVGRIYYTPWKLVLNNPFDQEKGQVQEIDEGIFEGNKVTTKSTRKGGSWPFDNLILQEQRESR